MKIFGWKELSSKEKVNHHGQTKRLYVNRTISSDCHYRSSDGDIDTDSLNRAREQGKRAACLSNLKQLQLAWVMYADDFDGKIVNGSASWDAGGENP